MVMYGPGFVPTKRINWNISLGFYKSNYFRYLSNLFKFCTFWYYINFVQKPSQQCGLFMLMMLLLINGILTIV
jgi:hypothetical protein